ncbi:phosphatase 2C-like domain-containing protein [Gigaspora rosea]|uniref:Protein phosphatase n=1 Tax=Gigaspora rosea TaxID=44941 RepID=A0A397V3B3_9GLOM|nr:phosphatase 2C-like domain-containing protein [Gigaspora rosea]CAG8546291.1 3653_t:CDS:2 [Gigaspora rosea]
MKFSKLLQKNFYPSFGSREITSTVKRQLFTSSPFFTASAFPLHFDALITHPTKSPLFPFRYTIYRSFHSSKKKLNPQSSKHTKYQEVSSIKHVSSSHSVLSFLDKPFSSSQNSLSLIHGASGIAKHTNKFVSTVKDKQYFSVCCGEDSFFRRHDSLGVADGVGGWRNVDSDEFLIANSALYSRKLMHYAYTELEKYNNVKDVNPTKIMQASYEQSIRDCTLEGVVGSSTALIAVLRDDELRITNIGDCGLCVIRHNNIIFRNEEQQHSFNYPFQLGIYSYDKPKDSQEFTIKIQKGDLIVIGSDGIFDNLYEEDILEEIAQFTNPQQGGLRVDPQVISDSLAWRAKAASEDINHESPFQSRAMQEGLYYQGGKKDDISVLVASII